MNPVKKRLLQMAIALPFSGIFATMITGCITLYHGYAVYFIYLMIIFFIIAIIWVLSGHAEQGVSLASCIFSELFIFACIAFNIYGLIVLFFPQWNGWNGWTPGVGWTQVYFDLPTDFNYVMLLFFLGLLLIYGGKKFFELDMDAMKKAAYKKKEVVKNHIYYIKPQYAGNTHLFDVIFKPRFLVKSEHWLHAAILGVCVYVILPFGGAAGGIGSSMARDGNNPIIATVFFVFGYLAICFCMYTLVQRYGRYRLIKELEKEMGVKLKPAVYQKQDD